MSLLWKALNESGAHAVLTLELILAIALGLIFVCRYARHAWWGSRAGRMTMLNMVAWVLAASGGLLYRLSLQEAALALLLPSCAVVLASQVWWIHQLYTSEGDPTDEPT